MSEYLSVSGYASLHGKDRGEYPETARRRTPRGTEGRERVDNPYGCSISRGRAHKSGKYHSWRKRNVLAGDRDLMAVISEMIEACMPSMTV